MANRVWTALDEEAARQGHAIRTVGKILREFGLGHKGNTSKRPARTMVATVANRDSR